MATEKAKGRPTVGEKMKTKEVGTTKKVRAKKQNEKDKEKAMDEEDDAIGGLLGIVAQHDASGGEFEVIDSGKVPDDKEKEEEEEEPKKADEKEDEDDDEAIEAELLRRMEERNEEEEAVAALRIQTKTSGVGSRRNSQVRTVIDFYFPFYLKYPCIFKVKLILRSSLIFRFKNW